ncbi:ankyrin repeat family protein / regulator of chromosome condensation (RCC1) family protein isoform X2 [Tasmannia lanceolata]|uniref:ankyrin repeat family protein / regulator of chromosome condensation (RCC1) family protein isoform X2 n=1 Tax=Tasmannia lanceolata TaxID=3420 RepID=UPI004063AA36
MEGLTLLSGSQKQTPAHKLSLNISPKDLWSVTREGSLSELDVVLLLLKKNGGSVDLRNEFGLTPLHIATWRNHVPIVRKLLAAGADPDARDGESGWSSLHRALHFGHLVVASVLLQSGASLTLEDSKCRTPIDLLSGPVLQVVGNGCDSVGTEVFSWGSGTNYQLGTGNAHIQKLPGKVDALQGFYTKIVAAAKFHSVAVGAGGELYTWGFGRGGRLGHPDFDIHSGQAAVITPRQVILGIGSRRVKVIAAAKHHTVIATEGGEVFTWGSNREGQLGYTSVDTQATPRRVSSLRAKIIGVASANKHSAAVSESGEVFTWGCNKEGQLGYGTSNSASNYTPRLVEYLKGRVFTGVAAAKYHTIALRADGEVFTWGHRRVTPERVIIARNIKKSGTAPLKFHRMERLHVAAIAAGMVHSTALTDDGALFYWVSSDPNRRCRQLYSLCGRNLVSISAGKYWTAAVTATGDVYMWDGKKYKDEPPVATRLHGVKRATSVSVGETHLLIICALYHPLYPSKLDEKPQKPKLEESDEIEELDEDFMFNDTLKDKNVSLQKGDLGDRPVPSLKSLCERVAAEFLVEPRNALQLLEIADSLQADDLRVHCEGIALRNLDYIFTVSAPTIANASPEILANLENSLDARSCEPWSYRRLPTPTATFPVVIDSEEESDGGYLRLRDNHEKPRLKNYSDRKIDGFLNSESAADQAIVKQVRALQKKLQQIEMLEAKQSNGHLLDDQQIAKLQTRSALESALSELGVVPETEMEASLPKLPDGKGCKKVGISRKQRRKSKHMAAQVEAIPGNYEIDEPNSIKGFPDVKTPQHFKEKGDVDVKETADAHLLVEHPLHSPKHISESPINKNSQPISSKKKNKKGGLSMFLSGALDDVPKVVPPPPSPSPKSESLAWGGTKIFKELTSLRDIQNEQSKTKESQPMRPKNQTEGRSGGQIRLSSFLPGAASSPIPVVPSQVSPASDGDKSTPPWAAAGTSPVLCRPSLRDIQIQQEKHHHSLSHSPKTTAGFSVSTTHGSPSESGVANRWFKPETDIPSSIRSIQIEERAMKDLKRFYKSVKLVKNLPQVP